MKKIKSLSAFIVLITTISFGFLSCDNEPIDPAIDLNLPPNGGGAATGSFTAVTGATSFNANETIEATYSNTQLGTQLNITGVSSDGRLMTIQILNPAIGTRSATNDLNNLLSFSYAASVNDQYANLNSASGDFNGTINITQFNTTTNKVSGTFSFTGFGALSNTAQIEVTQGVFTNISFTNSVVTTPTGPINGNSLFAKVDNVDYNPTVVTGLSFSGILNLNAVKGGTEVMSIVLPATVTPGTYALTEDSFEAITYGVTTTSTAFYSSSGSVTVTSHNLTTKKIVGTFNTVAKDLTETITKNVTQGTFSITYQ